MLDHSGYLPAFAAITDGKIHESKVANSIHFPKGSIVADIYKERWQLEIIFRWIKTNLKIKSFIGNSRNAVMTQLYVALIAYLLLCMFKFLSKIPASLQNLLRVIQINLFRRCSLKELFEPPPDKDNISYVNRQLSLNFS